MSVASQHTLRVKGEKHVSNPGSIIHWFNHISFMIGVSGNTELN